MSITVNNNTAEPIKVSINQWGNDGTTTYFTINPNGRESWNRTDNRGFVMYVSESHADFDGPYYVLAGSNVTFNPTGKVTGATRIPQ
ncbi:hypothetical protein [Fluviicola sp.]|uniref:hypothetical protein n=1 Tax=Fluviicola sp. TaxID=1917219 RepID=UPI0031D30304